MSIKPISISLSPNTEKDDIRLALKLIFQPWRWKRGEAIKELENEFKRYLPTTNAISFNSGRSAFFAILKTLNFEKGDEILLQAFTCNAAPNPIIWAGLKPIYVDVDEGSFNIDPEDLKKKITSRSKAVVIQHTFGCPADIDKILEICQQNNLILIEDCAHSLGAEYSPPHQASTALRANNESCARYGVGVKDRKIGTFGKVAFFSFSRDKVISSVWGGMTATNDDELGQALREARDNFGYPSYFWIFRQLLHPILMNWIILPLYKFFDLGKIFLVLSQWFQILPKAIYLKEKRGEMPDIFPKKMPNALAVSALNQFKKLERFNNHRKELADFYYRELSDTSFVLPAKFPASANASAGKPERQNIFLRFTIKHPKAHEIIFDAWHKQNILIGDWYTSPIAPFDTKLEAMQYKLGSCPKAEKLAKITLNLPTHINISQKNAQRIVEFLKKF